MLDWFFLAVTVLPALIVCAALFKVWRDRKLIDTYFQNIGGMVVSRGWYSDDTKRQIDFARHIVRYEANDGTIRTAILRLRGRNVNLEEDVPLEQWLVQEHGDSWHIPNGEQIDIEWFGLQVQVAKWMPAAIYVNAFVLERLGPAGAQCVLRESEPMPDLQKAKTVKFAAMLQRLRMICATADSASEGSVELVAEGQPVNLHWQVTGEVGDHELLLSTTAGSPLAHAEATPGKPGG